MKRFSILMMCFIVGVFACQTSYAQDSENIQASALDTQFSECETPCVSCCWQCYGDRLSRNGSG